MKAALQAAPAFEGVADRSLDILAANATGLSLDAGGTLFAPGDAADSLFVVAEGRLEVFVRRQDGRPVVTVEVGPGEIAGATQILTGGSRTHFVRASLPSRLIAIPKRAFEQVAEVEPAFVERLQATVLHRLRRQHLAMILAAQFGDLSYMQMLDIESLGTWSRLEKGAVLFRQGDPGDSVCLVVSGLLGVLVGDNLVNRVRHGELVGEMSVLTDDLRSATVYVIRQAELLRFGKEAFLALIDKHPAFALQIARLNIDRLRETMTKRGQETSTSVAALVPASRDVPLGELARRLAAALAGYCAVLHVSHESFQASLGASADSEASRAILLGARFPTWLGSQEGDYRVILLETAWDDERWTALCVQHSDQVITVGLSSDDPSLTETEKQHVYRSRGAGDFEKRLVLIHPDDCDRPRGTARWLECRTVEMHHHVRLGNENEIRRLARFLTGSAICLALGGGGARGFAHIGALRALNEAGATIDMVGGTSMGAVVGAEHALGMTPDQMIAANKRIFSNFGLMLDLTLPLLAFTSGKAYARTLQEAFGDVRIEDLWTPFFCTSSNISRARMALHRTGPLWQKVRASSGVQGLFPPVVFDGELHVDGALFSNLPADVMKSVCSGKVIAIDVSPPLDLVENTDYGQSVSGWKILWKRWFPGREAFTCTDLGTIMQRAGEAVSMANQKQAIRRMSDFYLQMPVEKVGLMSFGKLEELERIGYDFAREKIAAWRAAGNWIG
jgi:NTE family protein/lysophospholipid hydrolase